MGKSTPKRSNRVSGLRRESSHMSAVATKCFNISSEVSAVQDERLRHTLFGHVSGFKTCIASLFTTLETDTTAQGNGSCSPLPIAALDGQGLTFV